MSSLYVTVPGARVEKEYRHLLVMRDDIQLLRVPLATVGQVVLVGRGVGVTTPALHAILDQGAGLSIVSGTGELLGRLEAPRGKNLPLRRSQYLAAGDDRFCLAFARNVVAGKIANYRTLAMRWQRSRDRQDEVVDARLNDARKRAGVAADMSALRGIEGAGAWATGGRPYMTADMSKLRGIEGAASRTYFAILRSCVRPEFASARRSRRPRRDPLNAMLSLGYTLLGEAIGAALEIVGLDPYQGFFHADKYGRPALALDLTEEFRGPIVDSVVLTLVNRRVVGLDDFTTAASGGIYLADDALRRFLQAFSRKLESTIMHPLAGRPLTYRKCLEVQARQVVRLLKGEADEYRPFRVR